MFMEPEILVVKVSLKKPIIEFGHWLVTKMDHSGLPLYLILHPEEIEILSGARPVGLEVNLPTGILDDIYRGRKRKKIDLIFKKEGIYYLVEIVDKKTPKSKDMKKMKEYVRRFKANWREIQVFPIIVCPKESAQQALLEPCGKNSKIDM